MAPKEQADKAENKKRPSGKSNWDKFNSQRAEKKLKNEAEAKASSAHCLAAGKKGGESVASSKQHRTGLRVEGPAEQKSLASVGGRCRA